METLTLTRLIPEGQVNHYLSLLLDQVKGYTEQSLMQDGCFYYASHDDVEVFNLMDEMFKMGFVIMKDGQELYRSVVTCDLSFSDETFEETQEAVIDCINLQIEKGA